MKTYSIAVWRYNGEFETRGEIDIDLDSESVLYKLFEKGEIPITWVDDFIVEASRCKECIKIFDTEGRMVFHLGEVGEKVLS